MQLINPQLSSNSLDFNSLNQLIKDIDHQINHLSDKLYLNIVYGFTQRIDLDLYEVLADYKEILLDKLLGCNCLDDIFILDLSYQIQKLINTVC